jgi:glyoxylate utilization-related uncharacterized protein
MLLCRFMFVLDGDVNLHVEGQADRQLRADMYAYMPAGQKHR